jgi:hypothetical protein
MFALLAAHSHETSLEEYALDEDAFHGLTPENKESWAAIGAAFNTEVYAEVDLEYQSCQGVPLPEVPETTWPRRLPEGRPIQIETITKVAELLSQDHDHDFVGSLGAGHCVAVVQPPGTVYPNPGNTTSCSGR